jgi:hypothetical protein
VVVKNKAYVAAYSRGMHILDVNNPSNPTMIGSVDTPGYVTGIAVIEDKAYLAARYDGLFVIDVSNPSDPTIIGSADTSEARGIAVVGQTALFSRRRQFFVSVLGTNFS